jgi:signal peptidase II
VSGLFSRNRLIGVALAAVIAIIDQVVKAWVIGPLNLRRVGSVELLPVFNLTYVENRGISLGLLEASSMEMRWLLLLLTIAIALVVLVWIMREHLLGDILGLALILGGAIGNIYDRYRYGYVIDYADLHFGAFRPFLVFNIADAAITIGVVVILARALFVRDSERVDTQDAVDAFAEK